MTWLSVQGPSQGLADVFIDGVRVETVDGYAARTAWKVPHTYAGLTNARHVIRVVVRGAHNPSSLHDLVSSDAFVLTLLGRDDVAVYDASLSEWANDPAMPMERD